MIRTTKLSALFLALLLGSIGCVPETAQIDSPEESTPPIAQLVIELVEDETAIELTLTNTGDIDLFTALCGDYAGHRLIVEDASGERLVPLDKERRRIPGTDRFHPENVISVVSLTLAPGESIDAVVSLSAVFPFAPGREYSLQATRMVHCRNDLPVEWSQDEHGVATGQGYDNYVITSNTIKFQAVSASAAVELNETP